MPEPTRDPYPDPQTTPAGELRDRAVRPTGLLPKNTQTYVILAIAAVMVGAIAFSGGNSPKPAGTMAPKAASVIDPNLSRIQEYRNRIDEQARKLAAEQAQLCAGCSVLPAARKDCSRNREGKARIPITLRLQYCPYEPEGRRSVSSGRHSAHSGFEPNSAGSGIFPMAFADASAAFGALRCFRPTATGANGGQSDTSERAKTSR